MELNELLYQQMVKIRRFEEKGLDALKQGLIFGTLHTAIGQEADAVGVISCLQPDDIVVSNHRCHGHFLAYGGAPESLFAELMGKEDGVCGGRGGSQHLHWRNFYSNGVQGGTLPMACGMALAEKRQASGTITVVFMGDGTLGEGVVYESLNMASLWVAPILFVLENNQIAQTTPTELALAGSMTARFEAFGIPTHHLDSSDVLEIRHVSEPLVTEVRQGSQPRALVIDTVRFGAHSKGDDTRSELEMAALRAQRDPLKIHGARLSDDVRYAIDLETYKDINNAFQSAMQSP